MQVDILVNVLGKNTYENYVFGVCPSVEKKGSIDGMAPLPNPGERLWRTDLRLGRNVYALLSNDVAKASPSDPLIGTMENSELAQNVVDTHNLVILKFGRHYLKALAIED